MLVTWIIGVTCLSLAPPLVPAGPERPPPPEAADTDSPEHVVRALYQSLARRPGGAFQWDRYRTLFFPSARIYPDPDHTGGEARVYDVEEFVRWIDAIWRPIAGGPRDAGIAETEIAQVVERFGDIAQVFSTYEKHPWNQPRPAGRGINAIQLVRREGRWGIVSITWDEETSRLPIPGRYLRR